MLIEHDIDVGFDLNLMSRRAPCQGQDQALNGRRLR
jgi:hypothetical protein